MDLANTLRMVNEAVWGWPLLLFVMGASIIWTVALGGIQFRCFGRMFRAVFGGGSSSGSGNISPRQAFVNTLSANMGNGSFAGMAVATQLGGPGAAFWVVVIGFLTMVLRFVEVYTSTEYGKDAPAGTVLGGPMLYLRYAVGGRVLAYAYAVFCLMFGFSVGNAMQANSIAMSLAKTFKFSVGLDFFDMTASDQLFYAGVATVLFLFVLYVVFGGAARVAKVSDMIVPLKVGMFFIPSLMLLAYHYTALWSALKFIVVGAINPTALAGGLFGYTAQQAFRNGLNFSILATESGVGTAAILFGFTGSKDAMGSGLMGMLSTFISTLVCFLVVLYIVASGAWMSGATSAALNIEAFSTLFGVHAGWMVSFLSIAFGAGLLVTYSYVMRAVWMFLTGGRWAFAFNMCYSLCAALGALASVGVVFDLGSLANAALLAINLFGLLTLLPKIAPKVRASMCG